MIQIDNYRSCCEMKEILRILQRSESSSENFLWQNIDNQKKITPIKMMEIDFVGREVVAVLDLKNSIEEDHPIFVKLNHQHTVFKISEFLIKKNILHFTFPNVIKTLEMRAAERIFFAVHDERKIKLKAPSLLKQGSHEVFVRVLDVSRSGMGLMISETGRTYFKNNPKLILTCLGNQELVDPIHVETVYINSEVPQKYKYRRGQELKVGIKFLNPIQEQDLLNFLS